MDKEELERLSANIFLRLSVLGLGNVGAPPREGPTAINPAAVGQLAKTPDTVTRAGATVPPSPPRMLIDKHGTLTVRPKTTAACNLMGFRSLPQPTSFERADQSYGPTVLWSMMRLWLGRSRR